tara:strand:- start:4198 stop:4938 length:741 start_codon:yes stop_codon:yes gene_type:complete
MIKAFLIDDEPKSISILQHKLNRFCKDVTVVGSTQDPTQAKKLLEEHQPDLVFLDVAMPEMSGFDVLRDIEEPGFEIIFATGFDQYAVEAIKHCAIGYLVKPIDNDDLIAAVQKARNNIAEKTALQKNKALIENLKITKFQEKKVVVPTQDGLEFLAISDILHCEGKDGYTQLHFTNRKPILSSQNIGHFAKMFDEQEFFLVHKSHLVNLHHIDKYLNEGYLIIREHKIPVSRNRRSSFLEMIRNR